MDTLGFYLLRIIFRLTHRFRIRTQNEFRTFTWLNVHIDIRALGKSVILLRDQQVVTSQGRNSSGVKFLGDMPQAFGEENPGYRVKSRRSDPWDEFSHLQL